MNQQNYDQQLQQQQQLQQIHNSNQNFFQQRTQQIQNYGQGNDPLPVIATSPFQNMSSNGNIGNTVTTQFLSQLSQQQQSTNNDNNHYGLKPSSNFNNNR